MQYSAGSFHTYSCLDFFIRWKYASVFRNCGIAASLGGYWGRQEGNLLCFSIQDMSLLPQDPSLNNFSSSLYTHLIPCRRAQSYWGKEQITLYFSCPYFRGIDCISILQDIISVEVKAKELPAHMSTFEKGNFACHN